MDWRGQGADLLSDRDTLEATYEIVQGLAGGLVLIFLAFTFYNVLEPQSPNSRLVMTLDQGPMAASLVAFWLMRRRWIRVDRAHPIVVSLGLCVALNVALTVVLQDEPSDLRYMQGVVIGAGAIVLSSLSLVVLLVGTAALALPAALRVCSQGELMDFLVMQTTTSLLSVALYQGRVRTQKKLLALRQRAAQSAAELGQALARAEHEFAEHQRSDDQRRELEERLRQAQKLEALGTLAGGVAHDINNVLGAVTATASAAAVAHAQGEEVHRELADILAAARRGGTLARNVLSFARQGPIQMAPFRVEEVVRQVETLLVRTLPKNVQLSADCSAGEGWVDGDADQIGHALMNLCLNSADAIDGPGRIHIATRQTELDAKRASDLGTTPGQHVEILVSDTGRGIPPETLARVFEPYFSTKLHLSHSGLGLAMVYGTVQRHRGGISIRSTVGEGTLVTMVLPSRKGCPAQAMLRRQIALEIDPARNVLLFVDDEPVLRRAGERIVRHLGFQPVVAADGREALEVYGRHRASVGAVVLDVAMPVMDGAECFRALRGLDGQLPVVLTSGYAKDQDVPALLNGPRVRFLRKPYAGDELAEALAEVLQQPRAVNASVGPSRRRTLPPPPDSSEARGVGSAGMPSTAP